MPQRGQIEVAAVVPELHGRDPFDPSHMFTHAPGMTQPEGPAPHSIAPLGEAALSPIA
jgi:hypothetical protein